MQLLIKGAKRRSFNRCLKHARGSRLLYARSMTDSMDSTLVVLCTVPSAEVGTQLGRGLVEEQLAACVNIIPAVRSIYRWQGAVHDDAEAQLLIKTRASRFEALLAWIRSHHPYEEPEVIALPIAQGSPSYLAWIAQQTQPR
jgi:periplasmic divalent cation tolerance protein